MTEQGPEFEPINDIQYELFKEKILRPFREHIPVKIETLSRQEIEDKLIDCFNKAGESSSFQERVDAAVDAFSDWLMPAESYERYKGSDEERLVDVLVSLQAALMHENLRQRLANEKSDNDNNIVPFNGK